MAPELRTAHTADLDAGTRSAIRALMDAVFGGVSDDTFENVLGGMHTLLVEDGELVGRASVVQRRMLHGGRALRTGYIEGVAVREDRRRRGHGAAMMSVLERVVRSGYQLGALGALVTPRNVRPPACSRRRAGPPASSRGICERRSRLVT